MSSPRALAAAVAALTLVSLAPAAADEGEKYPIWWSPRLQLESLDKIDEVIDRHGGWPDAFQTGTE